MTRFFLWFFQQQACFFCNIFVVVPINEKIPPKSMIIVSDPFIVLYNTILVCLGLGHKIMCLSRAIYRWKGFHFENVPLSNSTTTNQKDEWKNGIVLNCSPFRCVLVVVFINSELGSTPDTRPRLGTFIFGWIKEGMPDFKFIIIYINVISEGNIFRNNKTYLFFNVSGHF